MKSNKPLLLLCLMLLLVLSLGIVSASDNATSTQGIQVNKISTDNTNNNEVNDNVIQEHQSTDNNIINSADSGNNSKTSVISKKNSKTVKEDSYFYSEDEEYGFNQGSYVTLSYKKIKTNQYNITAKVINSYNNPVKKGNITVIIHMYGSDYPNKVLSFKNGVGSYIQKFHTMGTVKIYSWDAHKVSYTNPKEVSSAESYMNKITVKSNVLTLKVKSADVSAKVPETSDVDEKVNVNVRAYDDGELSDKGKVYVYVDDKLVQSKKVSYGYADFSFYIKKTGKHVVEVDYKTDYGETYYDTRVIEITRKKEVITLTMQKTGDTCEEIVLKTKVRNDTEKIDKGYVLFKNNGKKFAAVIVKDGETTNIYRLPCLSGTYKITAEYKRNNKTLATDSKEIIVSNRESLSYDVIKTATTGEKIVFNATVTNPYVYVNYGSVKVLLDEKVLLHKAVKNDEVSKAITLPDMAGTYELKVQYIKKNNTIIERTSDIKITNSEKLSYTFAKELLPDKKYTFKVNVTSPNGIVKKGEVMFKLGYNSSTSKVKNGTATITIKTTNKEQYLNAIVSYIKYNQVVDKKTSTIHVYYPYYNYVYPPMDTINGNKIKISADVFDKNYKDAKSGKVVFYLNNKKIGTAAVKNGEAVLSYKVNMKAGIYKISSVYYDNNNQKVAKEDYEYMTVVNKLSNDKNIKVLTLYPSSDPDDINRKSIGSSEIIDSWSSQDGSECSISVSLTNNNYYYPKTNRLVKARVYYVSNNKVYTKTFGASYIFAYYMLWAEYKGNAPYKVEVAYKKMDAREKKNMDSFFASYP